MQGFVAKNKVVRFQTVHLVTADSDQGLLRVQQRDNTRNSARRLFTTLVPGTSVLCRCRIKISCSNAQCFDGIDVHCLAADGPQCPSSFCILQAVLQLRHRGYLPLLQAELQLS